MTAASSLFSLLIARRRSSQSPSLAQNVHFRRGRIFIGKRKLPRSSKLWLPSWHKQVHQHIKSQPDERALASVLQSASANNFKARSAGKLMAWLGTSQGSEFELDLAAEGPHVFIAGPTGSGKSQFLRLLLKSLTARYRESELSVFVADFKGSALLQGLPVGAWLAASIDDLDPTEHQPFWNHLANELERRELEIKHEQSTEYDLNIFGHQRLLLVVDEVAVACRSSPKAADVLANVAARGRSLGITMVAASQGMSGVPRELLLNLRLRIALAGTDQVELVQLGGQAGKLIQGAPGWVSARAISHAAEDRNFVFPLGVT